MNTAGDGGVGWARQESGSPRGQILVFVKDTVPSLSALMAAAGLAVSRGLGLQIVHIRSDLYWQWGSLAIGLPPDQVEDLLIEGHLVMNAKVRTLLSIYEDLDWTFVGLRGTLRRAALEAIRSIDPAAIVVGAQTSTGFVRWLTTRTRVPITIVG